MWVRFKISESQFLKLKGGSPVVISNKVQPSSDAAPKPVDP